MTKQWLMAKGLSINLFYAKPKPKRRKKKFFK